MFKKELTVFRKVLVSERLPVESGMHLTNLGVQHYISHNISRWVGCHPQWWMEEIELPSEEELKNEAEKSAFATNFKLGANYILNKLK